MLAELQKSTCWQQTDDGDNMRLENDALGGEVIFLKDR